MKWLKMLAWLVAILFVGLGYAIDYLKWWGVPEHTALLITAGVFLAAFIAFLFDWTEHLTPFRKSGSLSA